MSAEFLAAEVLALNLFVIPIILFFFQEINNMSSFKVPDDVLYVFKTYLGPPCASSSSMVCKQWRRMMCMETLTPYHVLSITEHQLQPILAALCRGEERKRYPALFCGNQPLTVADLPGLSAPLHIVLLPRCTGLFQGILESASFSDLQCLCVKGSQITDASIIKVAEQCSQLHTLDVSDTGGAITDASIVKVAECCSQLHTLNVCGTEGAITHASISRMAEGCKVDGAPNVNDEDNDSSSGGSDG